MIEIFLTYTDKTEIEQVIDNKSITFHFIDILSKKGKKEGWKLKNYWGAKKDPFSVVLEDTKPIRVFYSESENVIESLNNFIINYER